VEACKHEALLSIAERLLSQGPTTPMRESNFDILTTAEVAEMTRVTQATRRWWHHTGEGGPKSFKHPGPTIGGQDRSLKVVVAQHVSNAEATVSTHAARGGIPPPPYRLASVQCSRWRFVRVWASPTLGVRTAAG
jgi:hypothetical protein